MTNCGNVQKVFVPSSKEETKQLKPITGVEISDRAAEKILFFCESDKKDPTEFGLKVSVVKDGCSGNSYDISLSKIDEATAKGDKLFQFDDVTIIVEKLSYMFVIGSELDYAETLLMSGFQINNPNVKRSCSCGSSFSIK